MGSGIEIVTKEKRFFYAWCFSALCISCKNRRQCVVCGSCIR